MIKSQELDRDAAAALDEADPLRSFRDRFVIDDELVCLDGNSLGLLPRPTLDRLAHVASVNARNRLLPPIHGSDDDLAIGHYLADPMVTSAALHAGKVTV